MATQKRINSISDDPIGLSQVLDLNTSLGNLEQIEKNVNMGISWLKGAENSLDSVNQLILDVKTQASQLINASMSATEREDAIEVVSGILDQMIDLGNTQVNGNYVFGGTDTDILPLEYHGGDNPPWVSYNGNTIPFEIKTDETTNVEVGSVGSETFWDDEVEINSTNNTIIFKEDNGHGSASQIILEATLDDGAYTTGELEIALRNALNEVSSKDGYGVRYEVEYDGDKKSFSIREDGSYDGFVRTEFMWETGSEAYVNTISASPSINPDDINVTVNHADALTIDTPEPKGSEPFRLTWQGDGTWAVDNNPGYVIIPLGVVSGSDDTIGIDLNESGTADITITLDTPVTTRGQYIEFEIVSAQGDHSVGHEIGFNQDNSIYAPPTSDTTAVFVTDLSVTGANNTIVFQEDGVQIVPSATIAIDNYTDMDDLAIAIKESMEDVSTRTYAVSYDAQESKFSIREDGSSLNTLTIDWNASTASDILGFYPRTDTISASDNAAFESDEPIVNISIGSGNNKIDFSEILRGNEGKEADMLTATIKAPKTYTSHSQLALEVEKALEEESYQNGNRIDYSVTWDDYTKNFTIKENGTELAGFDLLWQTGDNAPLAAGGTGESIGGILGFDTQDEMAAPIESPREVEWGIFNTLIDLNQYLADNDTDGIERTLGRLDAQYNSMTSEIVDVGIRYNRLDIRAQITDAVHFSLTERKSTIEDVDIIEATLNLKTIQTTYEAALSSTATIMQLSLVDYL
jgi:flagellar hook-associated protein 3 FlgL